MAAECKTYTYHDDTGKRVFVATWHVDGTPEETHDDAALPQGYERWTDDVDSPFYDCKVVARDLDYLGGIHGPGEPNQQTIAIIRYSNDWRENQDLGDPAILIYDMIGGTERQYVDVNDGTTGLGVDGEGVEVYRPRMEITYEHTEATFPEAVVGALTGKVNDGVWKTRPAGTVLFTGARGRRHAPAYMPVRWRIEYHFIYHPDGHQPTWQAHQDIDKSDASGRTYLERTWGTLQTGDAYEEDNFALLPF